MRKPRTRSRATILPFDPNRAPARKPSQMPGAPPILQEDAALQRIVRKFVDLACVYPYFPDFVSIIEPLLDRRLADWDVESDGA